jgi:hypothetical protein
MAVYSVEGKLGTGKTKFCVWRAREALREGRRVASNVDLNLAELLPKQSTQYVRLPDKPTDFDLEAAGHGNPASYDEEHNGVMILDELGTWLNARSFQDPSRRGLIDWLIHARKHGWDVFLIVQDAGMIDKQVREALVEYQARCVRVDKVRMPVLYQVGRLAADVAGALLPLAWSKNLKLKRWGYLPRMHLTTARLGSGMGAIVAERWVYRGDELHRAYDTRQVFRADYPHGTFSVWHRAPESKAGWWARMRAELGPKPKPMLRPKGAAVQALAGLSRDEAWARAVSLAKQG